MKSKLRSKGKRCCCTNKCLKIIFKIFGVFTIMQSIANIGAIISLIVYFLTYGVIINSKDNYGPGADILLIVLIFIGSMFFIPSI